MYTGIAIKPATVATTIPTDNGRSDAPGTERTRPRATKNRRTNRPIAIITVRKLSQRVISRCFDFAEPETLGTGNCGAGPGSGPTAYVNQPCTGCPSTEIARQ